MLQKLQLLASLSVFPVMYKERAAMKPIVVPLVCFCYTTVWYVQKNSELSFERMTSPTAIQMRTL
jgi:hypothetical protein